MLVSLEIKNFALIDYVDINFEQGLNVLTGETGAGKSIVIDAVSILIGARASAELIRVGTDKASVSGVFIDNEQVSKETLESLGITPEEDNTIILQRELAPNGRNTCRVNGKQITLSMYKEVGRKLLDIYGQHDNQSLLRENKYLDILDGFGKQVYSELKHKTSELYKKMNELIKAIEKHRAEERESLHKLDLWKFQANEIKQATLRVGEEEELEKQRKVASNSEKLMTGIDEIYRKLYESNNFLSARDCLSQVLEEIEKLTDINDDFKKYGDIIEGCLFQIEDVSSEVRSYQESIQFQPEDLDLIEGRLTLINSLKRKYGSSIEEILAYLSKVEADIDKLENNDQQIQELEQNLELVRAEYYKNAEQLSKLRQEVGKKLEQQVTRELQELEMKNTSFNIKFIKLDQPSSSGVDNIEFLISPNPGEPLRSLAKIASGGELSRIMLAFKNTLSQIEGVDTLIFDEVDTGVGGRAIQAVGLKLSQIASYRQVICVTHAPQIAGYADCHFFIEKQVDKNRTKTNLTKLDKSGRVEELARMLAGNKVTTTTLKQAREMLEN